MFFHFYFFITTVNSTSQLFFSQVELSYHLKPLRIPAELAVRYLQNEVLYIFDRISSSCLCI